MTPDFQEQLFRSANDAADYLVKIAQVKDNLPIGEHGAKMPVTYWNGAIRGEYTVATGKWNCLCPIWHTGQAVKSLANFYRYSNNPAHLAGAVAGADFLLHNQENSGEDQGLLRAYENHPDKVNTSAVLEALDGLFALSDQTGEKQYEKSALAALTWAAKKAYRHGEGCFDDLYDLPTRSFLREDECAQGRPLLDDAVFLTGYQRSGNQQFLTIAEETADRLLRDEFPAGNWINYIPCCAKRGFIHPRHAYWWGRPMLALFRATGKQKYFDCFIRSVHFYRQAMRHDGGMIRNTYLDFNTDSFGHATSGSACACLMFMDYFEASGDTEILPFIESGLGYCMKMQFRTPHDANLQGAILEKILFPDGSDRSPYYLRTLASIFFIQSACRYFQLNRHRSSMDK